MYRRGYLAHSYFPPDEGCTKKEIAVEDLSLGSGGGGAYKPGFHCFETRHEKGVENRSYSTAR